MRLAGGNASKFKESGTSIYHDSGIKGDGGGQVDTMQNHTHSYTDDHIGGWGGTWLADAHKWANAEASVSKTTGGASGRTASENRPSNVTIELYIYAG